MSIIYDPQPPLFSLAYPALLDTLVEAENLLIIQDLDGVCMQLVRDPLTRVLDSDYVRACERLRGEFFVLTNGEHIGHRGVNQLVDGPWGLPGLGAGGVQWQTSFGEVSHPGVSEAELCFLRQAALKMHSRLYQFLSQPPFMIAETDLQQLLQTAVLNNPVSPTINTNCFYLFFNGRIELYQQLQHFVLRLLQELLLEAESENLKNSFFIHLAPNLGRDNQDEIMKPASSSSAGTTDFQLMLTGAIKEVGVLFILNHYYFQRTNRFPLGEDFNVRSAPQHLDDLLQLAQDHFEPALMPHLLGVGDTVTSELATDFGHYLRGGSDRGFLTLIQNLGQQFEAPAYVAFVDSSHGEVIRPAVDAHAIAEFAQHPQDPFPWHAVAGITDAEDPLRLNYLFPGGHTDYIQFFCELAERRIH